MPSCTLLSPLPKILGDRDRIGQLLVNLISNGVKYNQSSDPYVEVGAIAAAGNGSGGADSAAASSNVTIYVKDNGIGIEPQFHSTIFQLFRRLHPHDEYEGTGVGLSICAKIVQAHGGRIWVESVARSRLDFFHQLATESVADASSEELTSKPSPVVSGVAAGRVVRDEDSDCRFSYPPGRR